MSEHNIPADLYYNKDHEWVKIEGDTAICGISDYAQDLLTDVVFVELPEKGDEYAQFDAACVVESVKSVSDVYAPIGGKVSAVNQALEDAPEHVNEDPYGEGWMFKLSDFDESELSNLMTGAQYKEFIANEAH